VKKKTCALLSHGDGALGSRHRSIAGNGPVLCLPNCASDPDCRDCRDCRVALGIGLCDNSCWECVPEAWVCAEDQMGDFLQPWHLIVLAVVAFLLFGAKRLPELGKGLGEG